MKNYLAIIHIFLYVVILCAFIISMPAKGSNIPQKYSVTYFSTQNGVEDGLVNDIIQDHKGLLWFATWNGLYRFDGYNFKNYKSNTEDKGGLTNDRLLNIAEDTYGCIWVLCYDSTCYRFNPNKEIFEPISQEPSNHFQSIKVFPNGIVWLLREDGRAIRILTSADNLSMTYQSYSVRDNTLLSGNIQSVFMDSKQREWILTDNGLYSLNSSELSCISSTSSLKNKQFAFNFATELDGELYFGADQGKIYKYSSAGELVEHCQLPTLASVISILKTSSRLIYVTDTDGFFRGVL